ncbi:flippase [Candidatus Enterococcus ikei]|uniref:Flippase n=1 Tax=Candidatus Enterococcus ikei TaxID=2815326 RepID=A0ABS3GYP1_9ENTE|nr:flippase [Enterococcus sp. DIV0869a]MBO0440381.1 flippase [Enterococcus sp. DIV0869a]
MKKLASNFIYQSLYQLMLIILPIITVPVVSHALGPDGLGMFNYINSITQYFVLIAGLGLANYGVREIATVRNNKEELSKKFWELQIFNMIIALGTLILYIIFAFFMKNTQYYLIMSLIVLGALFDISWFYIGIEDFKLVTLANGIIKIISFIAIIVLIHNSSNLLEYFFIQSANIFLSQLALWLFIFKKITFIKVSIKQAFRHLKPALNFFIGKIAITLYTNLNKTLLGILASATVVGYYSNSLQLVNIIVALVGTIDAVLLPRMSNLFANKKEDEMLRVMSTAIHLEFFITIPAMFGIILTNEKLINWFFGEEFSYIRNIVPWLAPLVVIMPLGVAIVRQYLMPMNHIKDFNISVIAGAIIGILINLVLIPKIGIWGAVIATIASEVLVAYIRVIDLIKRTAFKFHALEIFLYTISSLVMYIVVHFFTKNMASSPKTTLIQGVSGIAIYMILTLLFRVNPLYIQLKKKKEK